MRPFRRSAFSLVELVIVVTIIGIISSIAVPRFSGAAKTSQINALQGTLVNVCKAIDVYYAEHGQYPGYDPTSGLPDHAKFVDQLLMYTDAAGNTNATPTSPYIFGPYLRAPFPRNPRNNLATVHVKSDPGAPNPAEGSVGWVAVLSHGYFGISATDADLDSLGVVEPSVKIVVRGLADFN